MSNSKKSFSGALVVGLMLVAVGVLWVLNNLNILDFRLHQWWPLILIALGLLDMTNNRRINAFGPWFLIILGGVFLLAANHIVEWREIWKYWPVILIAIGLSIIFHRRGSFICTSATSSSSEESPGMPQSGEDVVNASVLFGGIERKVTNKNFKGGTISTVFGGAEVDLRSAELAENGAVLDLSATFGGVEIWIPDSWPIELSPSVMMGAVTNATSNKNTSSGKRLLIKASVVFGGVDIKN